MYGHPMTTTTSPRVAFQTETCPRCCGTGEMPYSVKAGMCFRCSRKGVVLTKKGEQASSLWHEAMRARRTVAVDDVKVGDRVTIDPRTRCCTVKAISVRPNALGSGDGKGGMVYSDGISLDCGAVSYMVAKGGNVYRAIEHEDVLAVIEIVGADHPGMVLSER